MRACMWRWKWPGMEKSAQRFYDALGFDAHLKEHPELAGRLKEGPVGEKP